MANYIRQLCTPLGSLAGPLSELQGAMKHWKCTHLHDISFDEVKSRIMTNKVRKAINTDPSQRIYLVGDSSETEIAGCIGRKQEDD